MTSDEILLRKFEGAMLGAAVGDAIGAPVEGFSGERAARLYDERGWKMVSGRYTDDTEMMIGVAESLIACRGFNGEHMAMQFLRNYDESRGYGPGTEEVFRILRRIGCQRWREASLSLFGGEGSYGNGAAMRVVPVGLLYHDDVNKLVEVSYESSLITHAHQLAKEGAALQAYAVALAVRSDTGGEKLKMLRALKEAPISSSYMEKLSRIEEILRMERHDDEVRKRVISELGNGIEALNSVPTAIFSFLHTENFVESIKFAISVGGDTDTIAAMTGAISGAFHTVSEIPDYWLTDLERQSYIRQLADKLHKLWKEM